MKYYQIFQLIENYLFYRNYLSKIRYFKTIDGWLTDGEAVTLYKYSKKVKNGNIVEIGSWKGKSTVCLARGLWLGRVFAIDPFNADGDKSSKSAYKIKLAKKTSLLSIFINNLKQSAVLSKVSICKGYSSEWKEFFHRIDLLFIDGDHSVSGCKFDFLNYSKKVRRGGFIIFHDYYPQRKDLGTTYVINRYILRNKKYQIIEHVDSIIVIKKLQ